MHTTRKSAAGALHVMKSALPLLGNFLSAPGAFYSRDLPAMPLVVSPNAAVTKLPAVERIGDATESAGVVVTGSDVVFTCAHCGGDLVVDQAGVGMVLPCPHCQKKITVPSPVEAGRNTSTVELPPTTPPAATRPHPVATAPPAHDYGFATRTPEQIVQRIEELRLQLTENRSQGTEMRGHVNRATIELHRLQLKLQKLVDRQAAIEAELLAAKASLNQQA